MAGKSVRPPQKRGGSKHLSLNLLLDRAKKEAQLESRLISVQQQLQQRGSTVLSSNTPSSANPSHPSDPRKVAGHEKLQDPDSLLRSLMDRAGPHPLSRESEDQHVDDTEAEGSRRPSSRVSAADARRSVVWHCPAKNSVVFSSSQNHLSLLLGGESGKIVTDHGDEEEDNPLTNLPSKQQAVDYSKKLREEKSQEKNQQLALQMYLQDLQDSLVQKNKLMKQQQLNKLKEKFHEDLQSNEMYQQMVQETRQKQSIQEKLLRDKELALQRQRNEREKLRIHELKAMKRFQEEKQQEELQRQLELEAYRIKNLLDRKEFQEILRREEEERRMRYLEEVQRKKEERRLKAIEDQRLQEEAEKRKLLQDIQKSQARVRRGVFRWVDGKYQYYDSVRQDVDDDHDPQPTQPFVSLYASSIAPSVAKHSPPSTAEASASLTRRKKKLFYLQYDDAEGNPLYYDPILQLYSKRRPDDAEIIYYIDYEREQYDAVHGEGAYDAYRAEIEFKDSVNRNGGYYDDKGRWIVARGYYDENYEWVDLDGYYDENGRYVKYAKVQGDLSFMV